MLFGASAGVSLTLLYLIDVASFWIALPLTAILLLVAERNHHLTMNHVRESKVLELSQRLKLAMDASQIGIWRLKAGETCYLDGRAAALHGFSLTESEISLSEWLDTVLLEDRRLITDFLTRCAEGAETQSEVYRVQCGLQEIRHLRAAGASYQTPDGVSHMSGIIWDVTSDMKVAENLKSSVYSSHVKNAELELALQELSSREHDLMELSRRLDFALQSYNCGIWEANLSNNTAYWDRRMHQLYGLTYTTGYTERDQWLDCLHPDDREKVAAEADHSAANNLPFSSVQRVLLPGGEMRHVRSVGSTHTDRDGDRKVIGIAFDITADVRLAEELKAAKEEAEARNAELVEAKSRIEHNALHDPLTGLANRRKLDLELDRLASLKAKTRRFAILHLDLDRFKQINDTLGHAAGDATLVRASQILSLNVSDEGIIARIGGDEFVILIPHADDCHVVTSIASNIIAAFRQPFDFQGFSYRCGVSIGIAFGENHYSDARKILINADLALYRAKAMGRNRYEFFTQNLQADIVNHKRTADEILAGLERGEFETWYQPQLCARTGEIAGMEALVRWRHPTRGLLTPEKFLDIAEELNVVQKLDRLTLHTALQDRRVWSMKGLNIPRVSVNVSIRRLHDEHLLESLKELQIVPGEVAFELVESIFLDDSEAAAVQNLDKVKELGIDIEIDDFGTGHTSLISLLRLKPKRLKIDRQLVMPILDSPQERALVRSIIEIARSLGVETVAEGVETPEHAAMLHDMGCDILQGFAFAEPLPAQDFSSFAMQRGLRRVS
ncbi:EAL domain-containing protein [uncultured Agrobacterium sp.]|uniref:sensor domain-containing protein n=1 Tax=uncultured Agrobacterium sp. TaxID=157277 RepID=UPI0025E524CB|nr:EAL domain-containing protein [uncultured Agrobacterium sp.]